MDTQHNLLPILVVLMLTIHPLHPLRPLHPQFPVLMELQRPVKVLLSPLVSHKLRLTQRLQIILTVQMEQLTLR